MSERVWGAADVLPLVQPSYLEDGVTLRSWLLSTDHKRIAILYMVSITFFFFLGGAAAALIRYNLIIPQGALASAELYNRLFSMHGVVMVWFFLVPAVPVTIGNFILPLMIGARDLAFPRLNLLSWYLFIAAGIVVVAALFSGGIDTGWTFYEPLSSDYAQGHVVLAVTGVFIAGFSSIATGLNFIVTIHRLRAPGLTWYRLPIFVWSLYSTSVIMVLATPVLAITLVLLTFETIFHVGVFDPRLGGDPLLFQHMFWFYSHPAVYIMILPGLGVVSEIIPVFARKALFGYKFVAWASVAIAVIGFFVWGHHMFVSGQSAYASVLFSHAELPRRGALGDQGIQLARHAAQGLYPLRCADAVRARFHRSVHHGRAHRAVPGGARRGRPSARYVFRHRAFPLHHGGRHGLGVFRCSALLVAEDQRADVSRDDRARSRAADVPRLQSDLLPAVHPGLSRHAAAVSFLSAGVPDC